MGALLLLLQSLDEDLNAMIAEYETSLEKFDTYAILQELRDGVHVYMLRLKNHHTKDTLGIKSLCIGIQSYLRSPLDGSISKLGLDGYCEKITDDTIPSIRKALKIA